MCFIHNTVMVRFFKTDNFVILSDTIVTSFLKWLAIYSMYSRVKHKIPTFSENFNETIELERLGYCWT